MRTVQPVFIGDLNYWVETNRQIVPCAFSLIEGQGDLEMRMSRAFEQNFHKGVDYANLVGTDAPQLTAIHAKLAFDSLESHDVVLVPTEDGGYCLIGLRRMFDQYNLIHYQHHHPYKGHRLYF